MSQDYTRSLNKDTTKNASKKDFSSSRSISLKKSDRYDLFLTNFLTDKECELAIWEEENREQAYQVSIETLKLKRKDLTPTEILCYVEIRSLMSLRGYCWASNSYISKLLNLNPRHVQRLIQKLRKVNLIKTVGIQQGFKNFRRIYLAHEFEEFKKFLQTTSMSHTEETLMSHTEETPMSYITKNIKKEYKEEREREEPPPHSFNEKKEEKKEVHPEMHVFKNPYFTEMIKLTRKEYEILCKLFGESMVLKITEELFWYGKSLPKRFKEYDSHYSTLKRWLERKGYKK